MADVPSIKGSIFQSTVDRVRELVREGTLDPKALDFGDLRYLDMPILPSGWFPMDAYSRLSRAVFESRWGGDPERLRANAFESDFLEQGAYQGYRESAQDREERAGEIIVSMSRVLWNFSEWRFDGSLDGEWVVEVTDAAPFPDHFRFSVEGFLEAVFGGITGRRISVSSERPSPDRMLFHGKQD